MPESGPILYDINKVFIPCRTVLEMEALTSLFLENSNFDKLRELSKAQLPSNEMIEVFRVVECEPLERIIEYFIDVVVNRLKPIVMYQRDHHDRMRMGNVVAYTKTRVCLYLALHRLKLKFLFIKHFMDNFKSHNCSLPLESAQDSNEKINFLSQFYDDYYRKNTMNLKLTLSSKRVSERVSKLLDLGNTITNEDIINAITFKKYINDRERIRFIMKEIKASLFVCKVMFAKIDVMQPFLVKSGEIYDAEEVMISQDFIPEIIPAISKSYSSQNIEQMKSLFSAYEFLMHKVLIGINNAIETASGGQLQLELEETIYNTGNVFEF